MVVGFPGNGCSGWCRDKGMGGEEGIGLCDLLERGREEGELQQVVFYRVGIPQGGWIWRKGGKAKIICLYFCFFFFENLIYVYHVF